MKHIVSISDIHGVDRNRCFLFSWYDQSKRLVEQRMEMLWRGSRNYEEASQIFAGVLYNRYSPPPGFCFDQFCSDPPIQDDPDLFGRNVKERVDMFVDYVCQQARSYKTDHIIITMGDDFQYENAHRWYKNLDKLIKYVNEVSWMLEGIISGC